jgi:Arc/MetJ-type ribon-helix-helix transcriptional regulator
MKISLNFPDSLLEKLDNYCSRHDFERSEFVRMLVREKLEKKTIYPNGIHEVYPKAIQEKEKPIITEYDKIKSTLTHDKQETVVLESIPKYEGKIVRGWCLLNISHPFVKNKDYDCKLISWEDESGNTIVNQKLACLDCIEYYKSLEKGKLSYV